MFGPEKIDERGEIPAPFYLERHNFNPHELMGDFDYKNESPEILKTQKGDFVDKRGRRVNKHGWYQVDNSGHLIDISGHKKFDRRQLTSDGDIEKLFNYSGKRFDIRSVMGQFEKDANGRIMPQKTNQGLVDTLGRTVNEKGYLIDSHGNIVDNQGRQLWHRKDLKNGDFPKIFPYTKFNIKRI